MTRTEEILALAATGADAIAIACELLCDVKLVQRTLATGRPATTPPASNLARCSAETGAAAGRRAGSRSLSSRMGDVMSCLGSAAAEGRGCPTNVEIGAACGIGAKGVVVRVLAELRDRGLITVERVSTARSSTRVVTIKETGAKTKDPRDKLGTAGTAGGSPRENVQLGVRPVSPSSPEGGSVSARERPMREPPQRGSRRSAGAVDVTGGRDRHPTATIHDLAEARPSKPTKSQPAPITQSVPVHDTGASGDAMTRTEDGTADESCGESPADAAPLQARGHFYLAAGCLWIDGDLHAGTARQCCARQLPFKPYCAAHQSRAYDVKATQRSERRASGARSHE